VAITVLRCPEENEDQYQAGMDGVLVGWANVIDRGFEHWIAELWTEPDFRRRGIATALLDAVIADRHRIALSATPFDPDGMTVDELAAWYGRRGFQPDGAEHRMLREAAP
jgi:GNAT superfamily N-acetyltransferase